MEGENRWSKQMMEPSDGGFSDDNGDEEEEGEQSAMMFADEGGGICSEPLAHLCGLHLVRNLPTFDGVGPARLETYGARQHGRELRKVERLDGESRGSRRGSGARRRCKAGVGAHDWSPRPRTA